MTILKNSIHLLISFLPLLRWCSLVRSFHFFFLSVSFFTLIISSLRHHVLQLFKIITSLQPFLSSLSLSQYSLVSTLYRHLFNSLQFFLLISSPLSSSIVPILSGMRKWVTLVKKKSVRKGEGKKGKGKKEKKSRINLSGNQKVLNNNISLLLIFCSFLSHIPSSTSHILPLITIM